MLLFLTLFKFKIELIDAILLICWLISSISTVIIITDWFLQGYYVPAIFNCSISNNYNEVHDSWIINTTFAINNQ